MSNYTLKKARKSYIWSVKSSRNFRMIMLTSKLNPKDDFWWEVGRFIDSEISEMKLIGYKYTKDHYNRDVEEVFENTGKFMNEDVIKTHNNLVVFRSEYPNGK